MRCCPLLFFDLYVRERVKCCITTDSTVCKKATSSISTGFGKKSWISSSHKRHKRIIRPSSKRERCLLECRGRSRDLTDTANLSLVNSRRAGSSQWKGLLRSSSRFQGRISGNRVDFFQFSPSKPMQRNLCGTSMLIPIKILVLGGLLNSRKLSNIHWRLEENYLNYFRSTLWIYYKIRSMQCET